MDIIDRCFSNIIDVLPTADILELAYLNHSLIVKCDGASLFLRVILEIEAMLIRDVRLACVV